MLLLVKLGFFSAVVLAGLLPGQGQFVPANFKDAGSHDLVLFPANGAASVINIPFPLWAVKFGGDGRTLYSSLDYDQRKKLEGRPGLVRIDFSPTRSTPVAGTQGFLIKDFAVTQDHRKVVISGNHRDGRVEQCGLFEITVSTGVARHALAEPDCNYRWTWTNLTVSPDGTRAAATYGNTQTDLKYRLDLIDLVQGTTKSLGDLDRPVWSPDGKWIAAIEWNRRRLILLDASDFTRRRDLGSTIVAAWSPDSRYLAVWGYGSRKCGVGWDVEPPASLEILDVALGKRLLVSSSECQLVTGAIGWISPEIKK